MGEQTGTDLDPEEDEDPEAGVLRAGPPRRFRAPRQEGDHGNSGVASLLGRHGA